MRVHLKFQYSKGLIMYSHIQDENVLNLLNSNKELQAALNTIDYMVTSGNEGVLDDIGSMFKKQFRRIKESFSGISKSFSLLVISKGFTKDQKVVIGKAGSAVKLSDEAFDQILEEMNFTIVGMRHTLDVFALGISGLLYDFGKEYDKVLEDEDEIISKFLTDEQYRKSFTIGISDKMEKKNQQLKDILTNQIDANDHTDIKTVNQIVGNKKRLVEAFRYISTNYTYVKPKALEDIKKRIAKIESKVSTLVKYLENNNITATKPALTALYKDLKETGNYITHLSVYFYLNNRAGQVASSIYDKAKKVKV